MRIGVVSGSDGCSGGRPRVRSRSRYCSARASSSGDSTDRTAPFDFLSLTSRETFGDDGAVREPDGDSTDSLRYSGIFILETTECFRGCIAAPTAHMPPGVRESRTEVKSWIHPGVSISIWTSLRAWPITTRISTPEKAVFQSQPRRPFDRGNDYFSDCRRITPGLVTAPISAEPKSRPNLASTPVS